ncbi:MAG: hypothetical protein ACKVTZ_10350 [Bacteroidia bacterium]
MWILPGILLWKMKGEKNIYLVNVIGSVLFLFFMYRMISQKPHDFPFDLSVLDDFGELFVGWLLWGIFLLLYSIFRKSFKWKRK